jgi:DNA topoisomerase-3
MGKIIVFAEKPSVGKDIARVLGCKNSQNGYIEGPNYIVTWAMGHLVSLADPEKYEKKYANWNLEDLPILFDRPKFSILKPTARQYNVVKTLFNRKDVTSLVIATDAGREGELVARLVINMTNFKKPVKRLWISSVTDKAIKEGFNKLVDAKKYNGLYMSALARAESDWIVGINATRALTTKYNTQLSCGRVQSPTLYMIMDQDDKIKNFKPKQYHNISLIANDTKFILNRKNQEFKLEVVEKELLELQNKELMITNISQKEKKVQPKELYDLTTLQREANAQYGYGAKKTLDIIQSLYEYHKVVTYPRTDSRYLTSDMKKGLKERIEASNVFGYKSIIKELNFDKINYNRIINDNKVTDHHAIIPTEVKVDLDNLNGDEQRIYKMITQRFVGALLEPHVYSDKTIEATIGNYKFNARGKHTIKDGFTKIYTNVMDEEQIDIEYQSLGKINLNQKIMPESIRIDTNITTAPKHFTEGSLLGAMENPSRYISNKEDQKTLQITGGIGTVATRADIIEKLLSTFLIEKSGQSIKITPKGRELLKVVPDVLKSPTLTATWETKLKLIEQNKLKHDVFMKEIKEFSKDLIFEIKNFEFEFTHENMTDIKCQKCNSNMLHVNGKKSMMLVCSNLDCKNRVPLNINPRQKCPNCSKRLKIIGDKFEKQAQYCDGCGYRKSLVQIAKESQSNTYVSKSEVKKLIKKQQDQQPLANNPFANIFNK